MMRLRHMKAPSKKRLYLVQSLMLIALAVILGMLYRIQVVQSEHYTQELREQSLRRVRIPASRGSIFDRTGLCLAGNKPVYNIALFLEELRNFSPRGTVVEKTLARIREVSSEIESSSSVEADDIKTHLYKRKPLPLLGWENIDRRTMARWAEQVDNKVGMDFYTRQARNYPEGSLCAHLLGYVGRADPQSEKGVRFDYYLPAMTGRAGLEQVFDEYLSGKPGGQLVRIDVAGFRHGIQEMREPQPGNDLQLTIDAHIQKLAADALGDKPGAVVVVSPTNGDILASVSAPSYDLNRFTPRLSPSIWKGLLNDPERPLVNRAVAGSYPPGSIFKPVVALAALQQRPAVSLQTYNCPGYFKVGRATFHCWNRSGHGTLGLRQAIKNSCNVYFYKLALECGVDQIVRNARALGLGSKTGISVDFERSGLVPDPEWKRDVKGQPWTRGDLCNLSIGQGSLLTTPLQMAMLTAALANHGKLYEPRLIKGKRLAGEREFQQLPIRMRGRMNWLPESLKLVRQGMHDVIMDRDGTGHAAYVPGVDFAGKTGTAQYGRSGSGKHRGWMIAFLPFDDPVYAIAFMVEDAVSGGRTVGPRLKKLVSGLREYLDGKGGADAV